MKATASIRSFAVGMLPLRLAQIAVAMLLAVVGASRAYAEEAVCAEVRIEIQQKVSLERQAFDAVMRIRNGLATAAVEQVSIDVLFSDVDGNPVVASSDPNNTTAAFFIRLDDMDGISAIDGTGTVAPETTATIRWLIIPSASAGGSTPAGVMYMVGARVQYRLNDEESNVEVVPETITVKPQPKLALDYFLAGDVYSDDPFTPEVEPTIPFTLGLRVRNTGAGIGQNVSVESAQPRIVDNEQGLLVGFNIIGGYVNDQVANPSLLLDFGSISPGGVRMGRWLMETTLTGRFVSIDARYTHADTLGGALTSLIDGEPGSHLLVHDVLVELSGRDGVRDFLARDGDVLRVYESNGIDSEVTDRSESATLVAVPGTQEYSLSFPPTAGFSFVRLADPTNGTTTGLSVRRSDGRLLPVENAWFSKSRNQDLTWAYFLNVFDANGGGSYTVLMDTPPAHGVLAGTVYGDTNGNGERDATEFGLDGVTLLLTGDTVIGNVQRSAVSQEGGRYRFADLPAGSFAIAVGDAEGYGNGIHQAGSAGGNVEAERISQIVLGSSVEAEGYLFAKTPLDTENSADLQVVSLSGPPSVTLGTDTTVTIQVQNVGPQAALARTSLVLPESFALSQAMASSGTFDPITGIWSHGALVAGAQQNLVLEGSFSQLGEQVLLASIQAVDDNVEDPDTSNDSAQLSVLVEQLPTLSAALEIAPVSDVLVWVSCDTAVEPGCAQARALRWSSLMTGAQVQHRIDTDTAQFTLDLRSGEWPLIWIDAGLVELTDTLAAEIREVVRRGGSVLLSGLRDEDWGRFEGLTGAVHVADIESGTWSISMPQNEFFDADVLAVNGPAAVYSEGEGRVLAEYKPGMAAVVATPSGAAGTVVVFGFDPLPGIEAVAEPAQFVARLLTGAAVTAPNVMLDRSQLPLRVIARRPGATEETLALAVGFPSSFTVLQASPEPTQVSPTSIAWVTPWPLPETTFEARYALQVPSGDAQYAFHAEAQWQEEDGDAELALWVRSRLGQSTVAATAIDELETHSDEDLLLKQQAATRVTAALAAYTLGNQEEAIAALLEALAALDQMTATDVTSVAQEVSRMLLAMEREVPVFTIGVFSDGFEDAP